MSKPRPFRWLPAALGLAWLSSPGLIASCEGPPVGPEAPPGSDGASGAAGSVDGCEEYCARGRGCDRDCVHVCQIGLGLCPLEWQTLFACEDEGLDCDADGMPVSEQCAATLAEAKDCAPNASCAGEREFELCDGCCAAYDPEGATSWWLAFLDCTCTACASECGKFYCGEESGTEVECVTCYDTYCTEAARDACAGDRDCLDYDACVAECPTDATSHCGDHDDFDACYRCCAREQIDGAVRWEELYTECACSECADECRDGVLCEGPIATIPSCDTCIETTCLESLDQACDGDFACSVFQACFEGCPG